MSHAQCVRLDRSDTYTQIHNTNTNPKLARHTQHDHTGHTQTHITSKHILPYTHHAHTHTHTHTLTTVTVISYAAVHYSTLTPPVGGEGRSEGGREGVLTMGNDSIH